MSAPRLAGLCLILVAACRSVREPTGPKDAPTAEWSRRPATSSTAPRPATAQAHTPGQWVPLFDGRTLGRFKPLREGAFSRPGEVRIQDGTIVLERGQLQTGISWKGEFPRDNYEVRLEAMRTDGGDFFCGMTFPVGEEPCTLIVGGWGGTVVGLSNVNDMHAAENETTQGKHFDNGRWYAIRLRVTPERIEAWIDQEQVIDLERAGRRFSVWYEQEPVRPFGFATWDTSAALRNIELRRLGP